MKQRKFDDRESSINQPDIDDDWESSYSAYLRGVE